MPATRANRHQQQQQQQQQQQRQAVATTTGVVKKAADVKAAAKRKGTQELLSKIKICVTSLPVPERESVRRATEECGGEYSADLDNSCTHLLVGEAKGAKFEMALTWKLITVDPRWLWDSIEEGVLLPIDTYAIKRPISTDANGSRQMPGESNALEDLGWFHGLTFYAGKQVESIYGEKYERMITDGGGTLAKTFDASTTHYVVIRKHLEPEDEKQLLDHPAWRPALVRVKWLRECQIAKQSLPQDSDNSVVPAAYPTPVAEERHFGAISNSSILNRGDDEIVITKKRKSVAEDSDGLDGVARSHSRYSRRGSREEDPRQKRSSLEGLNAFQPILSKANKENLAKRRRPFEPDVAEASRSAWELL